MDVTVLPPGRMWVEESLTDSPSLPLPISLPALRLPLPFVSVRNITLMPLCTQKSTCLPSPIILFVVFVIISFTTIPGKVPFV